ncbi:putative NUMOD1 domain-containing DNA-binding protein [Vibrio phage 249E41-1]|nr:putative NUMOD1 domain-containing DNA-binding protein [Vibrio phage 249E41-1]CAH9016828.1 putative NUMOD1 domain-containing DNA-binding protein [Vibrio phage 193E37-1]
MPKECKDCQVSKSEYEFYQSNKSMCKVCIRKRTNNKYKKLGNGYDFTYKGVIRVLYKTQKRHQKLRGHGDMPYTKDELKDWLESNGFKELFESWEKSGHPSELKPSVDRLDDFKGYSLDNIRLVTWKENRDHQASDIISGKGTAGARCKGIRKLDKDGHVIKIYVSYQEVRREEGYCVHYAIKAKGGYCNGFYWEKVSG